MDEGVVSEGFLQEYHVKTGKPRIQMKAGLPLTAAINGLSQQA